MPEPTLNFKPNSLKVVKLNTPTRPISSVTKKTRPIFWYTLCAVLLAFDVALNQLPAFKRLIVDHFQLYFFQQPKPVFKQPLPVTKLQPTFSPPRFSNPAPPPEPATTITIDANSHFGVVKTKKETCYYDNPNTVLSKRCFPNQ
ncbi:hypothetical protein [Methylomonas sp. AM2-LC]|uniref:hypothetical protein n=1 Tax=Methylomonas sp. AM2-LC TaxID=3153301 RepID=UPI003267DD0B